MARFTEVEPTALIHAVGQKLQQNEKVVAPAWAAFVKTGRQKERPPANPNWWHTRCAAVLRTVALLGPIGTGKLVVKYGGKKRRGHKKPRFYEGSGSVARKSLQQLEAAGLIRSGQVKNRKGRMITPQGQQLLDKTAGELKNGNSNASQPKKAAD